jgi:hypothetical protein
MAWLGTAWSLVRQQQLLLPRRTVVITILQRFTNPPMVNLMAAKASQLHRQVLLISKCILPYPGIFAITHRPPT